MDPKLRHDLESFAAAALLLFLVFIVICIFCKIVSFISDFASRKTVVAIDTEMVGAGYKGQINMLARVSIVNKNRRCIYDEYVAPVLPVTDYRTFVSGIREQDLIGAKTFDTVRREVQDIIENCILVGHDLKFDLNALSLTHPDRDIRDTALYKRFRQFRNEKPSLKYLARDYLGRIIQVGEHSPIEDALAAMDLYLAFAWEWK